MMKFVTVFILSYLLIGAAHAEAGLRGNINMNGNGNESANDVLASFTSTSTEDRILSMIPSPSSSTGTTTTAAATATATILDRSLYSSSNSEYANSDHDQYGKVNDNGVNSIARAIFCFYVTLLMFIACLCSFLLIWKSQSPNPYDDSLDEEEQDRFYASNLNNTPFGNLEEILNGVPIRTTRQRNHGSTEVSDPEEIILNNLRQHIFDTTILMRKKFQLLLYIRHNHVEMSVTSDDLITDDQCQHEQPTIDKEIEENDTKNMALNDVSNHTQRTSMTMSIDDNSSSDNDSDNNNDLDSLELGDGCGQQAISEEENDRSVNTNNSTEQTTPCIGDNLDNDLEVESESSYLILPRATISRNQKTEQQQQEQASAVVGCCIPTTTTCHQYVPNCCAICLDTYAIGDRVAWSTNPNCKHAFHRTCIVEYLITMKDQSCNPCPICRQPFYKF